MDELISREEYSIDDPTKDRLMVELAKQTIPHLLANPHMKAMFSKLDFDPAHAVHMEDLPVLPVQMFKHYDLSSDSKVARIIKSSGTTSSTPSMVPLSKRTAMNQTKGLGSTLGHFLGGKRRTFLVIDHPGINDPKKAITARGAGVRGMSIYSKQIIYLLREEGGKLYVNPEALEKVRGLDRHEPIYLFGFTYIIWSIFIKQMRDAGISLDIGDAVAFHSGGWKNLASENVSAQRFNSELSQVLGMPTKGIHNFYGMAEQAGAIFVECQEGHKHVPNFAQVIIRDFQTMEPCPVGARGMVEVCSVLADSYYSHAILTEDVGVLTGIDDCPCGRLGRHFTIEGRVQKAEVRGCGDTFREGRT